MFAYMLGEWKDWRGDGMRRSLAVAVVATALLGAITFLHPLFMWMALALLSIALGWVNGNRYRPYSAARTLIARSGLKTGTVLVGKALSAIGIWLLHGFFLSPALALMAILWATPAGSLAALAAACLVAFYASLAIGFVASLVFGKSEGVPGLVIVGLWILSSFFVRPLRMANPFLDIWTILRGVGEPLLFAGMAAVAAAATLVLCLAGLLLAAIRRRGSDR
jgi:hypothetical protein